MTRHNMAAQPRKSSPRRKSSNDEKRPGYPLQRQGCEFKSLSPTQPDPVLVTYCTVKCRKPNKKLFKKRGKSQKTFFGRDCAFPLFRFINQKHTAKLFFIFKKKRLCGIRLSYIKEFYYGSTT